MTRSKELRQEEVAHIDIEPASGARKAELEADCAAILKKSEVGLSPSDFDTFLNKMMELLWGRKEEKDGDLGHSSYLLDVKGNGAFMLKKIKRDSGSLVTELHVLPLESVHRNFFRDNAEPYLREVVYYDKYVEPHKVVVSQQIIRPAIDVKFSSYVTGRPTTLRHINASSTHFGFVSLAEQQVGKLAERIYAAYKIPQNRV